MSDKKTDDSKSNPKRPTPKHIKHRQRVQTAEGWRRSQEKVEKAQTEKAKKKTTKK